jgi:hypothetical protein
MTWTQTEEAETKEQAIEQIKNSFAEDGMQVPEDNEIKIDEIYK